MSDDFYYEDASYNPTNQINVICSSELWSLIARPRPEPAVVPQPVADVSSREEVDPYSHSVPIDLWKYSTDEGFNHAVDTLLPLLAVDGRPSLIRSNLHQLLISLADTHRKSSSLYTGYPRREPEWQHSTEAPWEVSFKMVEVIDAMIDQRLLDHVKGRQRVWIDGEWTGRRSRIRPTQRLVEEYLVPFGLIDAEITCNVARPLVILRQGKKGVEFESTPETRRMEDMLVHYRDFMAQHEVSSSNEGDRFYIAGGSKDLHRIFNGSFTGGGRFYGHVVQNMKRRGRKDITIDGEPTSELDYRGNHICFMYAMHGICYSRDIGGDPYELDNSDWDRELVKETTLILLNQGHNIEAWRALTSKLRKRRESLERVRTYEMFNGLVSDIYQKHPPLQQNLSTSAEGIAGTLQYMDSVVCEQVLTDLISQNVPVIPVHDSFIVKTSDEDKLRASMIAAYSVLGGEYTLAVPEVRTKTRAGLEV